MKTETVIEKAARIKKKRQASIAKAQASPNSPANLHRTGRSRDDYDDSSTGRLEHRIRRKRVKRVTEGAFDSINWDAADGRLYRVKEVKRIVMKLMEEANIDSYAKHLLIERAAFVIVLIRNAETLALKGETFDRADYISLVGKLQTILTTLGIDNSTAKKTGLAAHIAKKENGEPAKRKRKKGSESDEYEFVDRNARTVV